MYMHADTVQFLSPPTVFCRLSHNFLRRLFSVVVAIAVAVAVVITVLRGSGRQIMSIKIKHVDNFVVRASILNSSCI